jgi:hypothetical protein
VAAVVVLETPILQDRQHQVVVLDQIAITMLHLEQPIQAVAAAVLDTTLARRRQVHQVQAVADS